MNEVEALRYAADFLGSKKYHLYVTNGVAWIALDRIGGAIKALEAEAAKREEGE